MVFSKMNHMCKTIWNHDLRSTLIKAACMQYKRWLNYRGPLYSGMTATYRDPVSYRDSAVYKTMRPLPEVAGMYSNISLINAFKVLFIRFVNNCTILLI